MPENYAREDDNQDKSGDLHDCHDDICAHRLLDASGVEKSHQEKEDERGGNGRDVDEGFEVVTRECEGEPCCTRDTGRQHREADEERDQWFPIRPLGEHCCAARSRIFGDQFGIRRCGQQRHDQRYEQWYPDGSTDFTGDDAHQRVDSGAQNVSEDEHEKEWAGDSPSENVLTAAFVAACGFVHVLSTRGASHMQGSSCLHGDVPPPQEQSYTQ